MNAGQLPPAAPHVVAAAVESLTSRLRKKLDAAVEQYAALPVTDDGAGGVQINCAEDTVVTLLPGPSGAVDDEERARCSCLLAPRCLHRAAVLSACPVAGPVAEAGPESGAAPGSEKGPADEASPDPGPEEVSTDGTRASAGAGDEAGPNAASAGTPPGAGQVAAGAGLWKAGAALLSAGTSGAGAVPQAELLRAAHSARLAGLPKAEAAALRVVRGLRSARERRDGHRLADLVSALRELLLIAGRLAAADPDPALLGSVRRSYRPGGSLRVYGVFREPVISATGYGGVVTHVITEDGRWYSVSDVKPGGPARARGAGTATVAIGSAMLSHAQLARAGLLINGATVSPDGRLGAGRGVRATPVGGMPWTEGPLAALFGRPLADAAGSRLSGNAWSEEDTAERAREPVGCDVMIIGASGDHVLARDLAPAGGASADAARGADDGARTEGPLIRLVPANRHPELAHVANLRRLASRPGLCVRVVGRMEPDRAATLLPLAVAPVPGAELTLRLPAEWQGRADLGYDRLQGSHLPPPPEGEVPGARAGADPLEAAPLWRVRRLVELAVAGGRRAVAESGRGGDAKVQGAALRRAGFTAAAELAATLTAEADRRERDVFGRFADSGPDRYAWAWLAAATHLATTERALVQASWQAELTG